MTDLEEFTDTVRLDAPATPNRTRLDRAMSSCHVCKQYLADSPKDTDHSKCTPYFSYLDSVTQLKRIVKCLCFYHCHGATHMCGSEDHDWGTPFREEEFTECKLNLAKDTTDRKTKRANK